MAARTRDLSRHISRAQYEHRSIEEALAGPLGNGVHSVLINDRWFDFLYEDRGAPVTLVTFSAAMPVSSTTYPVFSSRLIAENLGANFLGFADPAQGGEESLATYWHLNTARVETQKLIPLVIEHTVATGPGKNLLFFGSSAGGFAALMYSVQFPGSAVMVMNPRINLTHSPYRIPAYTSVVHPGRDWSEMAKSLPVNVAKAYEQSPGNFVVYLQNMQDENYVRHHYNHFLKVVDGRDDVQFVTADWGQGHVVPPKTAFLGLLEALVASAPDWSTVPQAPEPTAPSTGGDVESAGVGESSETTEAVQTPKRGIRRWLDRLLA